MKIIIDFTINNSLITIKSNNSYLYVRAIAPSIINISDSKEIKSFAIENVSIPLCSFEVTKESNLILIKTNSLIVKINDNLKVDFYDINENEICLEYENAKKERQIEVSKTFKDDDCIYGLGDKVSFMNKRGYSYVNWNSDDPSPHLEFYQSLYKSIPFFICFNKESIYGIFFDNHIRHILILVRVILSTIHLLVMRVV